MKSNAEIAKKTFDIILFEVDNPKGHWNKLHAGTRDLKELCIANDFYAIWLWR